MPHVLWWGSQVVYRYHYPQDHQTQASPHHHQRLCLLMPEVNGNGRYGNGNGYEWSATVWIRDWGGGWTGHIELWGDVYLWTLKHHNLTIRSGQSPTQTKARNGCQTRYKDELGERENANLG